MMRAKIVLAGVVVLVAVVAGIAKAQITLVGAGHEQTTVAGNGYILQLNLDKILLLQGGALQKE